MHDGSEWLFCLIPVVGLIFLIIWIIALADALRSDFKTPNEKLIWVLVIVFAGIIGAILYFLISDAKRKPDGF